MKNRIKIFIPLLIAIMSFMNVKAQTLSFTYSPTGTIYTGDNVTFTNTSTGFASNVNFVWDFNDECVSLSPDLADIPTGCTETTSGSQLNINHQFVLPGQKNVTLTAKSPSGEILDELTEIIDVLYSSSVICNCTPSPLGCDLVINGDFECGAPWVNGGCGPLNNPSANFNTITPLICRWYRGNLGGTPDYYYPCVGCANSCWVPNNPAGCAPAFSGSAYVGLITQARVGTTWSPIREYVAQQLAAPTTAIAPNNNYKLIIRVRSTAVSDYRTNSLQAVLSAGPLGSIAAGIPFPTNSQWQLIDIIPTLSDVPPLNGWQTYTISFPASGIYNYITIGNFRAIPGGAPVAPYNLAPTSFSSFGWANVCSPLTLIAPGTFSYYYIDKVELQHDIAPVITGFQNNCQDASNPSTTYSVPATFNTYSWNFTGMNGATFNPNNTSPSVNVNYSLANFTSLPNTTAQLTVTVTNGNSCSATAYLPIYQCCSTCVGSAPNFIFNNLDASVMLTTAAFAPIVVQAGPPGIIDLTNQTLTINGDFRIDQDLIIRDGKNICMGPEARISILANNDLTFESIDVANLIQAGCDVMWDGIYILANTSRLEINPNFTAFGPCTIKDAKNAVVSQARGDFYISKTIFERNNKGIVVNPYGIAQPHPGDVLGSYFFGNSLAPVDLLPYFTSATLNPGLDRTNIGIENNNNLLTIPSWLQIGDGNNSAFQNEFTYMDIGIRSNDASIVSYNNRFYNIRRIHPCPPKPNPCPPEGYCIYSKAVPMYWYFGINVNPAGTPAEANKFENSDVGVYSDGGYRQIAYVNNNTFDDVRVGVSLTHSNALSQIQMNDNTLNKFTTGLHALDHEAGNIEIEGNTFNDNYFTTQLSSAIVVEEPITLQFPPFADIHDNQFIQRVTTGIRATNVKGISFIKQNDIIWDQLHPLMTSYGVRLQNCWDFQVHHNRIRRCSNLWNNVPSMGCLPGISPNYSYFVTTNNISRLTGISVDGSFDSDVQDNTTAYLGSGIRCFNITWPNHFNCNNMAYNQVGFYLDNSNPGPGQQGLPTQPQDNKWNIYSFTPINDVRGTGSSATITDIWYMRTTTVGYPWNPPGLSPSLIIVPTATTPPGLHNPDCSNPIIPAKTPEELQLELADIIRKTREPGTTMSPEAIFTSQLNVYIELMNNPGLMSLGTPDDAYLQQFYDDATNTSIGAIAQVRMYIGEGDNGSAGNANSTINPDNQADYNEKLVNDIYLDTWANEIYDFTLEQYNTLNDIAEQNPLTGGPAVYTARVMLGVDYDDYGEEQNRLSTESEKGMRYVHVYPNPASDELNIEYFIEEDDYGIVSITDLLGREIISEKLSPGQHLLTLSTKDIEESIYFLSLKVNSEIIGQQKLLIAR